jgi:hypothetical protein
MLPPTSLVQTFVAAGIDGNNLQHANVAIILQGLILHRNVRFPYSAPDLSYLSGTGGKKLKYAQAFGSGSVALTAMNGGP